MAADKEAMPIGGPADKSGVKGDGRQDEELLALNGACAPSRRSSATARLPRSWRGCRKSGSRDLWRSGSMKAGAQRVVDQQRAVEAVAEAQQLLQHLDRLQRAEHAGDGAEDAGVLAARHQIGRRRLAEQAAIAGMAGAEIGPEGRELALERRQRRGDQRLFRAGSRDRSADSASRNCRCRRRRDRSRRPSPRHCRAPSRTGGFRPAPRD